MPITPFHFFPGILFKSFGGTRISWAVFVFANLLIDVEPIAWYLTTGHPMHPYAHTYLGAMVAGMLAAVAGRPCCECWLRFWNRQMSATQRRWLGVGENISIFAAWSGALLGTFSHVALDSVMHSDITPMWPFAPGNVLLQIISIDVLQGLCIATGIWGAFRLIARRAQASRSGLVRRSAAFGNLLLTAAVLILALVGGAVWLGKPTAPASFDAVAWRKVPALSHYGNPRWPMAADALASLRHNKPVRAATVQWLGQPDAPGSPTRLSYYLGFPGWLAMDPCTLDIEFTEEGVFLRAAIVQH